MRSKQRSLDRGGESSFIPLSIHRFVPNRSETALSRLLFVLACDAPAEFAPNSALPPMNLPKSASELKGLKLIETVAQNA
jgi:hypothetical protein